MDFVRGLVSLKKKRFQEDGFDLDLTYVTPQIIAMGYPSTGIEAAYRNPLPEVQRFFSTKHAGHYKIYNLCSERQYDIEGNFELVQRYPFNDHNAPPLEMIRLFCEDAEAFFLEMGFQPSELEWDDNGCITVTNVHPGYVEDPESGDACWWNIVHTGSLTAADGTPFPPKLVAEVQRTAWEHTYAFKLRPGDWLMLDNMRVQHGRLPYVASDEQKRQLLTVYSSPRPAF